MPGHEDTKQAWRARCQILGILTLDEPVQHTFILQYVTVCKCNTYFNRKKQILILEELVQHTCVLLQFIRIHNTIINVHKLLNFFFG